ncbi:hypothetical protein Xmau_02615 [Xenorhabdus mauleonii]|uniref:Uncharacterized protein n=1 Tax=Xenorhabdus mauleonii TaxID=351675 RepID=A0A1I3TUK4_9GAMM|nr:hypothetical protein Xmau_02615 [Xenorhabdus mauleonii]SFJ74019.1 hypothetical protein SAMN05421680_11515 [Xenorhabdus mauleonii]
MPHFSSSFKHIQFLSKLSQYAATKGNQRQPKATKGNQRQPKATKGNQRQPKASLVSLRPVVIINIHQCNRLIFLLGGQYEINIVENNLKQSDKT